MLLLTCTPSLTWQLHTFDMALRHAQLYFYFVACGIGSDIGEKIFDGARLESWRGALG